MDPNGLPSICACGNPNSLTHALDCAKGGYLYLRHEAISEEIGHLCVEAGFKDVRLEPHLLPLPPEHQRKMKSGNPYPTDGDDARLDVTAMGFWQRLQRAFFDIRVTNPLAPSYAAKSLPQHLKEQEEEKKRAYGRRILENERASFTPLVFTTAGGCGRECDAALKRLGAAIAKRTKERESAVMNMIRTRLSHTLIQANVLCLRGSREGRRPARERTEADYEIAVAEVRGSD